MHTIFFAGMNVLKKLFLHILLEGRDLNFAEGATTYLVLMVTMATDRMICAFLDAESTPDERLTDF